MKGFSLNQRQLELIGQIEELRDQLGAQPHNSIPIHTYGNHDPLQVELAICDTCLATGFLVQTRTAKSKIRWQVQCTRCTKIGGPPARTAWSASLMWNGVNLNSQDFSCLPLFALTELSPHEAHERIKTIRENLVLRIALSDAERRLYAAGGSTKKPGAGYMSRLEAYLMWAMLAHRLIKIARIRA